MANYRKSFNLRNGVQVDDDNFIVNANGLVGIGTSVPTEYLLNVYGDSRVTGITTTKDLRVSGVSTLGVVTASQLYVSGVVTAASFSGSASGLTGIYAIAVDGWYVNSSNSTISTSFSVGIGTTIPRGNLQVGTGVTINSTGNASYSGIITAANFSGSGVSLTALNATELTGTINNARLPSNINVGIITAATQFYGNLTGVASTADSVTTSANITVNSINSGFSTTGVSTVFTTSHVGTGGTAFAALNSGRIGVGTASPTSEIQVRKSNGTLIEVISDTSQARISVGQSVGVGKSTAVLRFGYDSKTFDIINNDTGNINSYLHAGPSGVGTGRFDWYYGQNISSPLMSLTHTGDLGIGITNPSNTIHVSGTSTVTENAWFGSDVNIKGTLYVDSLNVSSINATLLGNVSTTSGISTFNKIQTNSNICIISSGSSLGIGTINPIVGLDARGKRAFVGSIGIGTDIIYGTESLSLNGTLVQPSGGIGIGTTTPLTVFGSEGIQIFERSIGLFNSSINVRTTSSIGFNTTAPRAVVDFGNVGSATTRPVIVVPNISAITRNGIGQTPTGAMIFNTDTLKFQGYTGVAWTDFH